MDDESLGPPSSVDNPLTSLINPFHLTAYCRVLLPTHTVVAPFENKNPNYCCALRNMATTFILTTPTCIKKTTYSGTVSRVKALINGTECALYTSSKSRN